MNKTAFFSVKTTLILLLCITACTSAQAQENNHLKYVNPFIGTTKSGVLTRWGGNGGTYPGAVAPSGSVQISPETRVTGAKGYDYTDSNIFYFSCFRHFSGFPEGSSGRLFVMPVQNAAQFTAGTTKRAYSHQDEHAEPGYYRVMFKDDHTVAEAAAATRSAILRFTFPSGVKPQVFIGDAGEITFTGKRTLQGTSANTVMNFNEDLLEKIAVKGGYIINFKPAAKAKTVIVLKLSTSTINHTGAQNNINQELAALSLEQLATRTRKDWSTQLASIDVTDTDEQKKTVFYTALYHSLLIPWVVSDADGQYKGTDGKIHHTAGKYQYGGFSPWDTFRSLHPLLSLLYPEKQQEVILSMLDVYQQSGHLPTESMTGNHAVPIIVDSYLKGIKGFDKTMAYTAMKKNIMNGPFVQNDMEIYHQMGYVPFSNAESVTRTVEYAYNDWALGQYAKLVMNNDTDYSLLTKRGLNYRNLFNPAGLFMLPKKGKEFKLEPGMTGYKEGNKWIYSYFVPHNSKDLVNLMGGNAAFVERLDSAMRNEVILYDNETVLHLPYLFNTAGSPGLTQKWIRDIMLNRFSATPGGLPGNDDLGSMSSAYIFNALGFFPLSPGLPLYSIGAPLFESVTLHLANRKTFVIETEGQQRDSKYVHAVLLNKQPYEQLVLPHEVVALGGNLLFKMSKNDDEVWPKDKNPLALSVTKAASDIDIIDYFPVKEAVQSSPGMQPSSRGRAKVKAAKNQVGLSSNTEIEVSPDERFWVRFRLSNKGSVGTNKVILYMDNQPFSFKHCLVAQGETVTDSISCRLYRPGRVRMALSTIEGTGLKPDDKSIFHVTVKEPAIPSAHPFNISALTLKPVIALGSSQEFSYNLQNLTGTRKEFNVPVRLGDSLLYTDVLTLDPGEIKLVTHSFFPESAGLKTLVVESGKGSFKVYNDNLSSLLLDLSLVSSTEKDTLADRSGFGNSGIVAGKNPVPADRNLILLGDDAFVEVVPSASLDQMGESLSMMAWVYPRGDERGLIDMLTKGDHHVLQTNNNKTLTFFAGGWGRGDCTVNLPADWKNQWHHIAGVCKGDMLWLYIDGKLAGTANVDGSVNLSVDSKWQIGRNEEFPSERVFHGYMDNVKVYEQPLTAAEISRIVDAESKLLIKVVKLAQ